MAENGALAVDLLFDHLSCGLSAIWTDVTWRNDCSRTALAMRGLNLHDLYRRDRRPESVKRLPTGQSEALSHESFRFHK